MIIGADRTAVPPIIDRPTAGSESVPQLQERQGATVEPIRFHNPVMSIDASGVVVVQVRDSHTGEVKVQIPSEKVLKAYRYASAEAVPVPQESDAAAAAAAAASAPPIRAPEARDQKPDAGAPPSARAVAAAEPSRFPLMA